MTTDSKRRFLFNPQIAPDTFVLFFHRGPGETSWSIRNYSVPGSAGLRDASDFADVTGRIPPASEIRAASEYDFPAPAHPVTDLNHWHQAIQAKNAQYLTTIKPPQLPVAAVVIPQAPAFPVLNLPTLAALPKAQKRGDIERILYSPNSEDYVTWNFFQLLESVPASAWWPALLKLAGVNSIDSDDLPVVRLWQTATAPRDYEAMSRNRMRTSENLAWRERSRDMSTVEGPSEIDITLEGRTYVAFVEAKLGSDVSLSTSYDPERNQIVRNVDCVLEHCGRRRPLFWMFVRDRAPGRAYVQLMERYRTGGELNRALPHRVPAQIGEVVSGLAMLTWTELLTLLADSCLDGAEAEVELELRRRVSR